ncbi:MAG: DNA replication/repair protein RecF [Verrucomicrobiaceae bacterium]|nr:DNA replication/repair protein RecF [Verrucomicrobiaceae bacterium]
MDFSLTPSRLTITSKMLSEIEVRDFRCFAHQRLELHPQMTVLVGRNAQGKTSLLEAACVLLRLQSPRTSVRTDLIRFDSSTLMVEGRWNGVSLRCGMSDSRRRLAIDGTICGKSSDYLERSGLVVWMDHSDMNLLRGTSEHRRRYLDFAASQIEPGYLEALQGYQRALRSRNYILKRDATVQWRQVDAYGQLMAGFHQTLVLHREQLVRALKPKMGEVMSRLSFATEEVGIEYLPACSAEGLMDALTRHRAEEERSRTTYTGAHRDDFALSINGRNAEAFASEGQQRSISIALKIGQARVLDEARSMAPLLLVDDVFGELDPSRRRALLSGLPLGTQSIFTTTHLDWAGELGEGCQIVAVEKGEARAKILKRV